MNLPQVNALTTTFNNVICVSYRLFQFFQGFLLSDLVSVYYCPFFLYIVINPLIYICLTLLHFQLTLLLLGANCRDFIINFWIIIDMVLSFDIDLFYFLFFMDRRLLPIFYFIFRNTILFYPVQSASTGGKRTGKKTPSLACDINVLFTCKYNCLFLWKGSPFLTES